MSYCNLILLHPLANLCCFLSYYSKKLKHITETHMGGDHVTEAVSADKHGWVSG